MTGPERRRAAPGLHRRVCGRGILRCREQPEHRAGRGQVAVVREALRGGMLLGQPV